MITDYETACVNELIELDKDVQERLKSGWQPWGSLVHVGATQGNSRLWVQPMVKSRLHGRAGGY